MEKDRTKYGEMMRPPREIARKIEQSMEKCTLAYRGLVSLFPFPLLLLFKQLLSVYPENIYNEKELLLKIAEGDRLAFREVYDRYYIPLCFFARSMMDELAEAEDLVQEVFCRLWIKKAELTTIGSLKAYLYTSVRNAFLDDLKHKKRVSSRREEMQRLLSNETGWEEAAVVREEVLQLVMSEIEALPEKYGQVIKLLYINGKNYREISEQLQVPEATIRKQRERAVELLQSALLKKQLPIAILCSPHFIYFLNFVTKA